MKLTRNAIFYCTVALLFNSSFKVPPVNIKQIQFASFNVPGPLTPYTPELKNPLTARKLRDAVLNWNVAWKQKEVTVAAYRQGISGSGTYRFVDKNDPGVIILQADISSAELEKLHQVASDAEYILIRGTIKGVNRSLHLTNCSISGGSDTFPPVQRLSPFDTKAGDPVSPQDLILAVNAWHHVEVTIQDRCSVPLAGNTVSFEDGNAKDKYANRYAIVRAVFKKPFKNAKATNLTRKVRGRVNHIDEATKELSLYNCELLP